MDEKIIAQMKESGFMVEKTLINKVEKYFIKSHREEFYQLYDSEQQAWEEIAIALAYIKPGELICHTEYLRQNIIQNVRDKNGNPGAAILEFRLEMRKIENKMVVFMIDSVYHSPYDKNLPKSERRDSFQKAEKSFDDKESAYEWMVNFIKEFKQTAQEESQAAFEALQEQEISFGG